MVERISDFYTYTVVYIYIFTHLKPTSPHMYKILKCQILAQKYQCIISFTDYEVRTSACFLREVLWRLGISLNERTLA